MKTRLSIILLLFVCLMPAQAKPAISGYPKEYPLESMIFNSDAIVFCEETEFQDEHHNLITCKVLQTFKGNITPGSSVTAKYLDPERVGIGNKPLPLGKALLFLHNYGKVYGVDDAKLIQGGKVFQFVQQTPAGQFKLMPQKPENITLAKDQKYGEKELLEDMAIAMKKAAAVITREDTETENVMVGTKNDVELKVSVPCVVDHDKETAIMVKVSNNSKNSIRWGTWFGAHGLGIKVLNSNDNSVAFSNEEPRSYVGWGGADTILEPGKSVEWKIPFALDPGKYIVFTRLLFPSASHDSGFGICMDGINVEFK